MNLVTRINRHVLCSTPFRTAIVILFAVGSSGFVFGNELPGRGRPNWESRQDSAGFLAPRSPIEGELTGAQEDRKTLATKAEAIIMADLFHQVYGGDLYRRGKKDCPFEQFVVDQFLPYSEANKRTFYDDVIVCRFLIDSSKDA